MPGGYGVKVEELLRAASPGARIHLPRLVARIQVRLVPDLPIPYVPIESIGPTLIVVTDDMFAYDRPLLEVCWRKDAVFLDSVLNLLTEAVEHFRTCRADSLQIAVSHDEII